MITLFCIFPLGLLSWFSHRELRRGTSLGIAPLVVAGAISLGSKLFDGFFGNKGEKKKEEAANKAAINTANLKQTMGEDKRLSSLEAAQSILGGAGNGYALDPSLVAKLGVRRSYDFSGTVPEAGAGAGSSFAAGLFDTVGDTADQYMANKIDAKAAAAAAGAGAGKDLTKTASSDTPFMPTNVAAGPSSLPGYKIGRR